jgi:hypothetical protein
MIDEKHETQGDFDPEKTIEIPAEEMRRRIAKSYPELEPYESGEFPSVHMPDNAA